MIKKLVLICDDDDQAWPLLSFLVVQPTLLNIKPRVLMPLCQLLELRTKVKIQTKQRKRQNQGISSPDVIQTYVTQRF